MIGIAGGIEVDSSLKMVKGLGVFTVAANDPASRRLDVTSCQVVIRVLERRLRMGEQPQGFLSQALLKQKPALVDLNHRGEDSILVRFLRLLACAHDLLGS